jgi:glycerate 2-kinase
MKILVVPDKFKGSLSADEVCRAVFEGLVAGGCTDDIQDLPLADGGEGTCVVLTQLMEGRFVTVPVADPLFRMVNARYGVDKTGKTAFIEMASASGLALLKPEEQNPLDTTTYGTGQLIQHALSQGVDSVILGIGGSATNDAGIGMMQALGVRFKDRQGKELRPVGKNLGAIEVIDTRNLNSQLSEVRFTALCDVTNPLFGEQGAAFVFAPQKGADVQAVRLLNAGLQHYAVIVKKQFAVDINFPGAGAGGGIGAGAKPFLNIQFQPGIDFITRQTGLEEKIKQSDVVISGEGKIDQQTLSGKVVKGVAQLCKKHAKPLCIITGKNELSAEALEKLNAKKILSLTAQGYTVEEAMAGAFQMVKDVVRKNCAEIRSLGTNV